MSQTKPPLGLRPQWVADSERAKEIIAAIERYLVAGDKIPTEWLVELCMRIDHINEYIVTKEVAKIQERIYLRRGYGFRRDGCC